MNSSQAKILGYVLSVGGNPNAGATVNEIIKNTGLSQNSVYTNLRVGVPGLSECAGRSPNGAKMYYCTPKSISEIGLSEFNPVMAAAIKGGWLSHPELTAWAPVVKTNLTRAEPSFERLEQIILGINNPTVSLDDDAALKQWYIVAGLTLASIAMGIRVEH
jgi:hypothetical protein